MGNIGDAGLAHAAMLEREQDQRQFARRRLERKRQVDVVGAELDAQLAHLAAHILVQVLDVVGHLAARDQPQMLMELVGNTAGRAFEVGRRF
ncbi:hypothetical protein D3C72_2055960 [compost metagenome]